ncbi:MAG: ADP-ribosylation factor family protein [Candidatus Hermodarchaeota archaeon]
MPPFRSLRQLFSRSKKELKVLLLGLDSAGKTTFVKRMKLDEYIRVSTTMGINQEIIELENLLLRVLDLGGQETFRTLIWPELIKDGADLVIFVIDANDQARLLYNEEELHKLFKIEKMKTAALCILANKQDLGGALPAGELMTRLGLVPPPVNRSISIFPTSMVTGEGLEQVYNWIKQEAEKSR